MRRVNRRGASSGTSVFRCALRMLAVVPLVLSGCGNTSRPDAPQDAAGASSGNVLRGDGVSGSRFGTRMADVRSAIDRLLGPADFNLPTEIPMSECQLAGSHRNVIHWGDFGAVFTGDGFDSLVFSAWTYGTTAYDENTQRTLPRIRATNLKTERGLGLGNTVDAYTGAYGGAAVFNTEPEAGSGGKSETPSLEVAGEGVDDRMFVNFDAKAEAVSLYAGFGGCGE